MTLTPAVALALLAAGVFFSSGLLTGVWKYVKMNASPDATAPMYVDIAHRTSLMYSFASILVAVFAFFSQHSDTINFYAVLALVSFFALSIEMYLVHGWLNDTDNQLRRPHRLGKHTVPHKLITAFMWSLVAAEIGGFAVLLHGSWGVLWAAL